MMNCLAARAALLADPHAQDAALLQHLSDCPACRTAAAAVAREDALLRSALHVSVPEQLTERILLQTELARGSSLSLYHLWQRLAGLVQGAPGALAVALSLLVAIGIWVAQPAQEESLNWGEVALAHVIGEPSAVHSTDTLPPSALAAALAAHGLTLTGDVGVIRVVSPCPVPGGRGSHIVIETHEFGRVTLILPPVGKRTSPGEARGEGLVARMVEIGGVGFGIVTTDADQLPALANLLAKRIVSA
jgi:anti-sigma factor RsiW